MTTRRVYLLGPISGLSYEEATQWRKDVRDELDYLYDGKIKTMSPMSHKESLQYETEIKLHYADNLYSNAKSVFMRDVAMVRNADLILGDLTHMNTGSIGSFMELGIAYERNIPIILVIPPDKQCREHPFLSCSSNIVDNLDQALDLIDYLLGDLI